MTVCGLPLEGMPEGVTPLSAVVVVKALDLAATSLTWTWSGDG